MPPGKASQYPPATHPRSVSNTTDPIPFGPQSPSALVQEAVFRFGLKVPMHRKCCPEAHRPPQSNLPRLNRFTLEKHSQMSRSCQLHKLESYLIEPSIEKWTIPNVPPRFSTRSHYTSSYVAKLAACEKTWITRARILTDSEDNPGCQRSRDALSTEVCCEVIQCISECLVFKSLNLTCSNSCYIARLLSPLVDNAADDF